MPRQTWLTPRTPVTAFIILKDDFKRVWVCRNGAGSRACSYTQRLPGHSDAGHECGWRYEVDLSLTEAQWDALPDPYPDPVPVPTAQPTQIGTSA